jgi:type III restriction enzyme
LLVESVSSLLDDSSSLIFLTNIHRIYAGDDIPASADDDDTMDYFLGKRPTGSTTDSKVDLGVIVRDIDELLVLNDEAHHIHDPRMVRIDSASKVPSMLMLMSPSSVDHAQVHGPSR